jgi:hypothetical protein
MELLLSTLENKPIAADYKGIEVILHRGADDADGEDDEDDGILDTPINRDEIIQELGSKNPLINIITNLEEKGSDGKNSTTPLKSLSASPSSQQSSSGDDTSDTSSGDDTSDTSSDEDNDDGLGEMKTTGVSAIQKRSKQSNFGRSLHKSSITTTTMPEKIKIETIKGITSANDSRELTIADFSLEDRLGKKEEQVFIKADKYFINNRKIFIKFINDLLEPYHDALIEEAKNVSCDRKNSAINLMTHQAIIRDYINLYSPYRGLLIYHGLGAGKTCGSIAIAEGIKSEKIVVVMTPASLRENYISELKKCGDQLYRLNQFWEFIETNGDNELEKKLSYVLNISLKYIKNRGGAWMIHVGKPPNFETLETHEVNTLNEQIDEMIRFKYQFINYNSGRGLNGLETLKKQEGVSNPFDNKIIIVDEAHNFVSRIVNKVDKVNSISYKLYDYLLSAENCKIVFLTGTPIINYPNEIGILFNMLRGYIKTFNFKVNITQGKKVDQRYIEKIFKRNLVSHDYVKYNVSKKTIEITRNPYEFTTSYDDKSTYEGVGRDNLNKKCNKKIKCAKGYACTKEDKCEPISDVVFVKMCIKVLETHGIDVVNKSIIGSTNGTSEKKTHNNDDISYYKALPDNKKEFENMFIDNKNIKNIQLFQKRILGLTSYFRSAQEELMPAYDPITDLNIIHIPMSDYQFNVYREARSKEREMDKNNAKQRKKQQGNIYDDTASTYRIFSRAFCNYVFPKELPRPMPIDSQELTDVVQNTSLTEDDIDALNITDRISEGKHDSEDISELQDQIKINTDITYPSRIANALRTLKERADDFLSSDALKTYSPKFLQIVGHLTNPDNIGLHLIYSQFRTLEGIGILSIILEANGFAQFKLKKNQAKQWVIDVNEEDRGKPKFALYTGTENKEEKEIVRNIYNGDWDNIPSNIKDDLEQVNGNNNFGEIIKIFMITSSGAEGINLRNTRFVHIVEPYWHPVRNEQVIGRARRICSHNNLPVEYRNVKVFLYLMVLSITQKDPTNKISDKVLLDKDFSKNNKNEPFTSDQTLWEISTIKENINKQILDVIKGTSIDCSLHRKDGDEYNCLSYGSPGVDEFILEPNINKAYTDKEGKLNKRKETVKYKKVSLKGVQYVFESFYPRDKTCVEGIYYKPNDIKTQEIDPLFQPEPVFYIKKNEKGKLVKTNNKI